MTYSINLISQYVELKADDDAKGCVLLMQVGSFMHIMDDDARIVSALTGLKLKMAGDIDSPHVVGGFPVTGLDAYLGKLLRVGHSVAIAMQNQEKERGIVEIISVTVRKR
jgi:DNA mismatch repair ATPase MutS